MYRGSWINHHGIVTIPYSYGGENSNASFYVTDTPDPAILGLPISTDLNLLKFNRTIQTQHLHSGGGAGAQTISNSPDQPKEPPPFKDKQDLIAQYPDCFDGTGKFQGEYHTIRSQRPTGGPSTANGRLRLCLDPKDLNAAIQRGITLHLPYKRSFQSGQGLQFSLLYMQKWVLEHCS